MSRVTSFIDRIFSAETSRAVIVAPQDYNPWLALGVPQEESAKLASYLKTSNAVYVCSKARAQRLSSLPLRFYKVAPSTGKKIEVKGGQLVTLMTKVNPFWTLNRLLEMTEM